MIPKGELAFYQQVVLYIALGVQVMPPGRQTSQPKPQKR